MNITKAEEALNRLTERIMRFSQWNGRLVPEDASDVETLRAFIAQAGEDAERLDWLMHMIRGSEFRRLGVMYAAGCDRESIDAARSAAVAPTQLGEKHD